MNMQHPQQRKINYIKLHYAKLAEFMGEEVDVDRIIEWSQCLLPFSKEEIDTMFFRARSDCFKVPLPAVLKKLILQKNDPKRIAAELYTKIDSNFHWLLSLRADRDWTKIKEIVGDDGMSVIDDLGGLSNMGGFNYEKNLRNACRKIAGVEASLPDTGMKMIEYDDD